MDVLNEKLPTLNIGDKVKIIFDSQFNDNDVRRIGQYGKIIELDPGDEWAYKVKFQDGQCNWFKRYILEKC
jgi:hypothetical protein